ncbi:MAG: transposase [Desulfobacterium sp.]|jgi:REP element-mobilizing transposase RayT|nr:transposase [Desulfobacterium sp.]
MARALRIEFEGACYHVLSRGNNRCPIFQSRKDYQDFLELLEEMSDRFSIIIYAYVLMGNHYHLLLKTMEANLARAMQWFGTSYTRRFNIRNSQNGHLFQGRFKSILVENDSYFMGLSLYIHRNPIRAGMVKRLSQYEWSSYLSYAYAGRQLSWLNTNYILSQLGDGEESYRLYREKVNNYSDEARSVWDDVKFGFIYGSQSFIKHIKEKYLPDHQDRELPQLNQLLKDRNPEELIHEMAQILDCDIQHFKKAQRLMGDDCDKRDVIITLLGEVGLWNNQKLGEQFGLTHSSASRRLSRVRGILKNKKEGPVAEYYNMVKKCLGVKP